MFLPINEALQHVESGSLTALAITSERRSPLLSQVPAMREAAGKTTMGMDAWQGAQGQCMSIGLQLVKVY
ncbi:MAG: hypothetical protein ABI887_19035, partial [Burkholderiales bacterium]